MTTLANFEREAAELESFQFWRFRFVLQSQLAVTSSLKPAAGRHTGRHTQTHKANKYIQIVREGVKKQLLFCLGSLLVTAYQTSFYTFQNA